MIRNPDMLLADFIEVATLSGFSIRKKDITHESLSAPHGPAHLPKGRQAVYVFSLPTPPYVVLKVGKAGPRSNARYQSQHYNPRSATSTLARSLADRQDTWEQLGIQNINETSVGSWIKRHVDRDNLLISSNREKLLLSLMEIFLQCRLQPIFEGLTSGPTPR